MSELTTLASVKALGTINGNADDGILAQLISRVSVVVQDYVCRTIASTSYTETRNGTGKSKLLLRVFPVTAVASVTVDGVVKQPRSAVTAGGYAFDERLLYLVGDVFTAGVQNVVVQYTAGYAVTPPSLEQLVIELVLRRYQKWYRGGRVSEVLDQQNVTYLMRDLTPDQKMTLNKYRPPMVAA